MRLCVVFVCAVAAGSRLTGAWLTATSRCGEECEVKVCLEKQVWQSSTCLGGDSIAEVSQAC